MNEEKKMRKESAMSVYHLAFSPTGGTEKVCSLFMRSFCEESIGIDLCDRSVDFPHMNFRRKMSVLSPFPPTEAGFRDLLLKKACSDYKRNELWS